MKKVRATKLGIDRLKRSSIKISKGGLRRSLLVAFISTLFIILCLYCNAKLTKTPHVPLENPDKKTNDIFVRTTEPRVVIFVLSNQIDDTLCYSVGSAYLSGLPVVVIGYVELSEGLESKFDLTERAIVNADLNPNDVVIILDSETLFTGGDFDSFLDRFIAQSAATSEELDGLAVRQDFAMAPLLVGTECGCFPKKIYHDVCAYRYKVTYDKVQRYAEAHPKLNLTLLFNLVPHPYVNSGVVVARVWAYKEFVQKANHFAKTRISPLNNEKEWNLDQTIYAALYLDLLTWEIEQDVFLMPVNEREVAQSPHGVRAGFLELDFANAFSSHLSKETNSLFELHNEHWVKHLSPDDGPMPPYSRNFTDFISMSQYVAGLYNQAYTVSGGAIFINHTVPMMVNAKRVENDVIYLILTPPLLALKLRPIDTMNNTIRRTFPVVIHTGNLESRFLTLKRLKHASVGLGWFTAMVHNSCIHFHAMEHLASLPLFIYERDNIIRKSYFSQCHLPFEETIEKLGVR
ncbi:unnamed protein product [Phytomonas sp. Hart1]|nr:unnamed protein product [Phytomonas sp. Hart1]|eukprot:CCW67842.1 unnamed protein product [Phytomonas sp. isolate Hart1]